MSHHIESRRGRWWSAAPRYRRWACAVGLVGLTLLAGVTPAGAAGVPSAVAQTFAAMHSLHSYRFSMDLSMAGGPQGASKVHMDGISVRHGTAVSVFMKMTTTAQGHTVNSEFVFSGAKTCIRVTGVVSWECLSGGANLAPLLSYSDINKTLAGKHMTVSPLGHKTVQGTVCDGYRLTLIQPASASHASVTTHGTIWVSAAKHWLVEYDWKAAIPMSAGAAPVMTTAKEVWSHYNDPTLTIPATPAG